MSLASYPADMAEPWLFPDANPDICLRATVRELLRRFGKRAVREAVENEGRERVRRNYVLYKPGAKGSVVQVLAKYSGDRRRLIPVDFEMTQPLG